MTERQLVKQNLLLTLILIVLIVNLILDLMPYIGSALILRSIFKTNISMPTFPVYTPDPATQPTFETWGGISMDDF